MANEYSGITVDITTKQSTNNDSYNEIPYLWTYLVRLPKNIPTLQWFHVTLFASIIIKCTSVSICLVPRKCLFHPNNA
jgi:hypothetical protein